MDYTEKEKLELTIKKYVEAWFDGLVKSWKIERNKEALRASYDYVARQAVKAYLEQKG
jgi:hypothetical protein